VTSGCARSDRSLAERTSTAGLSSKPIAEHAIFRFRAHGAGAYRIDAHSMPAELAR